ncbi:MAG: hypothetical protein V1799_00160 [bacterium]
MMPKRIQKKKTADRIKAKRTGDLPLFCDYFCTHAEFGAEDAIGACRKALAVYCKLFKQYHTKNLKCPGRT